MKKRYARVRVRPQWRELLGVRNSEPGAQAAECALQRRDGAQREHDDGTGCARDEQSGE